MTYLPPLNGGRLNATISGNTAGAGALLSTGTLTLAGGNNITLSQNGNALTISAANAPSAANQTLGMSNLGNTSGTSGVISGSALQFAFAGGNNITLSQSLNASSGTITISAPNQSVQTQNMVSILGSTGNISFANGNNITFGGNASTVTASASFNQTNQSVGLYALGNTTQNSSTSLDARSLSFNGLGAATMGYSNGSIQVSVPAQSAQTQSNVQALYDGANSIATGTVRLSNANGISFGLNGQTLTASYTVPTQSNQTQGFTAGTTGGGNTSLTSTGTFDARSLYLNAYGNISAGFSNSSVFISATQSNQALSGSNGSLAFQTATFGNLNGLSFYTSNGSMVGSYTVPTQSNQTLGLYALGNTTQNSSTSLDARSLSFNGLGAASVGYSNGSIQLSVPQGSSLSATGAVSISSNGGTISIGAPAFSAGMSNIGNSAGTSGTISNQLVLAGGNNITLSQATGAAGNTLSIIGGAGGGGGGGVAFSNSQVSYSSGTIQLLEAASAAITIASTTGSKFNISVPATSSLAAAGAISISTTGSTISVSAPPYGTIDNWEPAQLQHVSLSSSIKGNANVFFFKLQPQAYVSATRLNQLVSINISSSSNSSHAGAISFMAGIYTANGSTLSLITQSSGSQAYQWTNTSNASMSLLSGLQGISIPFSVSMAPDNYWIGMWSRTSTTGANWFSASNVVISNNTNVSFNGLLLQSTNATQGAQEGVGYLSATSSALPASAAFSQITQSVFRSNLMPYMIFKNNTW